MSEIEATKFYVRHREGLPETELQDYARRGMWTLGVETVPFEWVDDIDAIEDLGPTVGVAGYIGDVHRALKRLGVAIPENVDYPEPLKGYLGRRVWRSTLGRVRSFAGRVFVKPVEHKAFTGFVWTGCFDSVSRRRVVTMEDDAEVWCSEHVEIRAEYRSFLLDNEVLDVRLYKGDWSAAPSRHVVETAARAMRGHAPRAYCLDWAVTAEGETILMEMNEGFAFGHYGLHPVSYARMLSARWNEMLTRPAQTPSL